ncbi:MAG: hypothetical protein J7L82_04605 [Staphylothermus sp.]|nr:hypothetical protein [Staphylothermus sp.]
MSKSLENSCVSRWSRLLKKRELVAYYLLCGWEGGRTWNIGEAVDYLIKELCLSRKTAINIIRRFKRLELLNQRDQVSLSCVGFKSYLEEIVKNYVCLRKRRC